MKSGNVHKFPARAVSRPKQILSNEELHSDLNTLNEIDWLVRTLLSPEIKEEFKISWDKSVNQIIDQLSRK